jgi:hypothetical protein
MSQTKKYRASSLMKIGGIAGILTLTLTVKFILMSTITALMAEKGFRFGILMKEWASIRSIGYFRFPGRLGGLWNASRNTEINLLILELAGKIMG